MSKSTNSRRIWSYRTQCSVPTPLIFFLLVESVNRPGRVPECVLQVVRQRLRRHYGSHKGLVENGYIFAQMFEDIGETEAEAFRAGGQGLRVGYQLTAGEQLCCKLR